MKIVLHTNIISPHQLPLARELVKLIGAENYRYIYAEKQSLERVNMGWHEERAEWLVSEFENPEVAHEWLEEADVLISGFREFDLFARRAENGLRNFYTSERWFKPPFGMLRLMSPAYLKTARRFVESMRKGEVAYLPIGVYAAHDARRLFALFNFQVMKFFGGRPSCPFGRRWKPMDRVDDRLAMFMWGYFVAPSACQDACGGHHEASKLRVLWAGRMLEWKRVDVLIHAIELLCKRGVSVELTLVGTGPELNRLKKMAQELPVAFLPNVPIDRLRQLMHSYDLYVLPSNGYEGWGAVVSEALEEGMFVLGARDAGASATLLPLTQQFPSSDSKKLAELILGYGKSCEDFRTIGEWSARIGARKLLQTLNSGNA